MGDTILDFFNKMLSFFEGNLFANICSAFSAIGTIVAVILSLVFSRKSEKPNLKIINSYRKMANKNLYSIVICNNDINKSYSIKEIRYANKKNWININLSELQCLKNDYDKIVDGKYKLIYCHFNEKIEYRQELYILLTPKQVKELINSNKKRKANIVIILFGEKSMSLKVPKKYLKQFI